MDFTEATAPLISDNGHLVGHYWCHWFTSRKQDVLNYENIHAEFFTQRAQTVGTVYFSLLGLYYFYGAIPTRLVTGWTPQGCVLSQWIFHSESNISEVTLNLFQRLTKLAAVWTPDSGGAEALPRGEHEDRTEGRGQRLFGTEYWSESVEKEGSLQSRSPVALIKHPFDLCLYLIIIIIDIIIIIRS